MTFFRPEAVRAREHQHLGTIVLQSRPVSWFLAAAVSLFVAAILAILILGEYTRRASVPGYLIPEAGVTRVVSPMSGQLMQVNVREGDAVASGQPLAVIADERRGVGGTEARASVLRQIESRKQSLYGVAQQQRALFAQTREGLQRRIAALELELQQLQRELRTQHTRLEYAQATSERYRELAASNFVSRDAAQERIEAAVDQQARLQMLERAQTTLGRDLVALRTELRALPMREHTQLAEIERSIAQTEQEGLENRVRREVVITAPHGGRVSGLISRSGAAVGTDRPLLVIVPDSAALEAHLFAPSRDIGFVRPGQEVAMRYSAFPYQKFGHYRGVVAEVSRTPLMREELDFPLAPKVEPSAIVPALLVTPATEPVFRVRVRLERPTALVYGEEQALQPGMQLDADILLDRRTLVEWILEPLYSLRGKYLP